MVIGADEVVEGIAGLVGDGPGGQVPGAVVGVRHRGVTTLAARGATAPGGPPLRPDAVVRLSSNTKPLVAALALRLVAGGVLALDDPVDRLLPELADRRVLRRLDADPDDPGVTVPAQRPVTVEDLLTMRLGFGLVVGGRCPTLDRAAALGLGFGPPDPQGPPPPDVWLARLGGLPLLDQPGSAWRYELSSAVLGVLLARAADRPLGDLLADELLAPLGMRDTGFVATPERLVPSWMRGEGGQLEPYDGVADSRWLTPPAFPDGRGGLVGSAEDLLRFAGTLLDGGAGLLDPGVVTVMTTDRLTPTQRAAPAAAAFLDGGGWGHGVGVVETTAGRRYGWAGGLGTLWYSWPDHDLAAVLVTQVSPPSGPVFAAFTRTVEEALAR